MQMYNEQNYHFGLDVLGIMKLTGFDSKLAKSLAYALCQNHTGV